MNHVVAWLVFFASAASLCAQEEDRPAGFEFIIGPRVGANYILLTPQEFSDRLADYYIVGDYFPVTSLFGVVVEQRIRLGETRSHFAFQELLMVSGLEQGVAIPSGLLLIGYRAWSGFEVGFGPRVSLNGLGVTIAAGWTFRFTGVFVPVDLSFVLPSLQNPASVALTT